jgi:serine phosphatase RsbU (regulator of sigma subunit)
LPNRRHAPNRARQLAQKGFVARARVAVAPGTVGSTAAPASPQDGGPHHAAHVAHILEQAARGTRLEEILDFIYERFRNDIPFDRISLATVDGATGRLVALWARSEGDLRIAPGYSMELSRTSLARLLESGRPRIIGNLERYLREHPDSEGTRLLVAEGLRSSLTCPLTVNGRATGFLFFNSRRPEMYSESHVGTFEQLASTVALLFEHGRLFDELTQQKAVSERQRRQLAEENRRHNEELELARAVQRALIHGDLPASHALRCEMLYEPATVIGGDLVECIGLDRNTALVCVADAMGHGVPAALVMSVVRTALHSALAQQPRARRPSPASLLAAVNRTLIELFDLRYVTAVFALVNGKSRTVTLSLAGHPAGLLRRHRTVKVEAVAAQHVPLGVSSSTPYADIEVQFAPGDALVLCTDGVLEAEDVEEDAFGQTRLQAVLEVWESGKSGRLADAIRAAVAAHVRGVPLLDDLAVLTVEYRHAALLRAHW